MTDEQQYLVNKLLDEMNNYMGQSDIEMILDIIHANFCQFCGNKITQCVCFDANKIS